jgi:RNA polymerase sigma-70 factor, ECF subfamily
VGSALSLFTGKKSGPAFDEFFAAYSPRLYRFALGRLDGNEDAAEEIVQRVLIRGLERLRSYRGEAALLTWLCTLCRHEIAAWRGRHGRAREGVVIRGSARAARDARLPRCRKHGRSRDRAAPRELTGFVQLTLDHLPGRYGEVLEWKYIHDLSVDEIAHRLGVGYKAAESLLTRARAAFREGFSFVSQPPRTSERT